MKTACKRLGLVLALTTIFGFAEWSRAAEIRLIAYVSQALLLNDGVTPLPDGSIVMIFGSADNVNDGMAQYGSCYLPYSTQGDDVYLGTVYINPYYNGAGTFVSDQQFFWENTEVEINYFYIRFFNTAEFINGVPVEWGQSPVQEAAEPQFQTIEHDFIGGYLANQTNCFVIIPEPGTASLFLLFGGLLIGLRAGRCGRKTASRGGGSLREET